MISILKKVPYPGACFLEGLRIVRKCAKVPP
jgi:hypothetical protein